jgi:hypothetical protein
LQLIADPLGGVSHGDPIMTGEGTLQTIAEVSITLAGFSALIAVFRQGGKAWRPEGLMAIRGLIEFSLIPAFFALLPFPLFYSGLSEAQVWRLCSFLFGTTYVLALGVNWFRVRVLTRSGARRPQPRYARGMWAVGIIGALSVGSNALVLPFGGLSLYIAGLLLVLVVAGLQLISILAVVSVNQGRAPNR